MVRLFISKLIRAKSHSLVLIQGNGWTVICTAEHPFLVDGRWKPARDLTTRDILTGQNGMPIAINFITEVRTGDEVTVFNFTVEDNHTYCITELGIVVHNK